ncbi:VWA domain-containing protein [Candidatus Pacearchaeota archaeon]|nr:VWA domain-containing protein [Candidatus Pacearchaeota archaeon]
MKKRAAYFSFDALVALIIILIVVGFTIPIIQFSNQDSDISGDFQGVLSSLKIGEIDNAYVDNLKAQGKITDYNKNILEQIGEFYVTNITLAQGLATAILSNLNTTENIGIWYGNTLLASMNNTPYSDAVQVGVERQTVSGISNGSSLTGYSARAFLKNTMQTKYFYFGGYVGEGNLSARIEYNGNISSATMELAIDKNFSVYVNSNFAGAYEKSVDDFTPRTYTLPITDFNSGVNIIEILDESLHIAGGFIKVTYDSAIEYEEPERYYFPGVEGIMNLYDSFYIPGTLNTMDINLNFDSEVSTFLTIGNVTVYQGNTSGMENIVIDDSILDSLLDYSDLSRKTVPLRFGILNASYVLGGNVEADVYSVSSLSGEMNKNLGAGYSTTLINQSYHANKRLIDMLLNESTTNVGLVGYKTAVYPQNYLELTNTKSTLYDKLDESWVDTNLGENDCLCCGIEAGVNYLLAQSDPNNFRSVVVMGSGKANQGCSTADGVQDAIDAACDAWNNHEIMINVVGFGKIVETANLIPIAACGNGTYYESDIDDLVSIYEKVAEDIINLAYKKQTIIVQSGSYRTNLTEDSYIEFGYDRDTYTGLIATIEEPFDDPYTATFQIPPNSTVINTQVISYSGPRWTNRLTMNNNTIYDLEEYGDEYIKLGDPYVVNIPTYLVSLASPNTINLTTGLYPGNHSPGSINNKVIYTISTNLIAYSKLSPVSQGCDWTLYFNDGSNQSLAIPLNYSGGINCNYGNNTFGGMNCDGSNCENSNDAVQIATYRLLKLLDFDNDGLLDVMFTDQNFDIGSNEIMGIPYSWSTEVQIRTWR